MTASERRRRWEQRICNADGVSAVEPKRTRVVLYLSDEARETLRLNRGLHAAAQVKGLRDSELIEELLAVHVAKFSEPMGHLTTLREVTESFSFRWLQRKCAERHNEPPDEWGDEIPSASPLYRRAIIRSVLEEISKNMEATMDKRKALEVCTKALREDAVAIRKLLLDLKPFIDSETAVKLDEREIRVKAGERIEAFLQASLGLRAR